MKCAPFVPSNPQIVRLMLHMAQVGPGDVVYDLGCGDGRILFMAVEEFGAQRAVGFEIDASLSRRLSADIARRELEGRVRVVHGDFFEHDLSEPTVITLYLTDRGNSRLAPKLKGDVRPGTRIVSHYFKIPNWQPARRVVKRGLILKRTLYLYKAPDAFAFEPLGETGFLRRLARVLRPS